MSNYLYRFRSGRRLVGTSTEPGELENLQIYFASSTELNDPLEGHKEYFWQGDEVLWWNFLSHYVRCLMDVCLHYYTIDSDVLDVEFELKSYVSFTLYPNEMTDEGLLLSKKIEGVLSESKQIKQYIQCLSGQRKIGEWELLTHLRTIHTLVVVTIFDCMLAEGCMDSPPIPYTKDGLSDVCGMIDRVISSYAFADDDSNQEFYLLEVVRTSLRNLQSHHLGWDKGIYFLYYEFPELFIEGIKHSTHPKWYAACFMEDCSNSSIWGTYGDYHKGICLKYRVPTDEEGNKKMNLNMVGGMGEKGFIRCQRDIRFYKVNYGQDFVGIDFFHALGKLTAPCVEKHWLTGQDGRRTNRAIDYSKEEWRRRYWEDYVNSITMKSVDWQCEREHRLMFVDGVSSYSDKELRYAYYDFNCLEGIIFGIRTPISEKVKVISIVESLCKKHNRDSFNFYQAVYSPKSKAVEHLLMDVNLNINK